MDRLIQAGLTGGIASGKTTAASVLARLGARIVDTDELARRALDPATPAFEAAVRAFGRQILNADGAVDRARLGDIVFAEFSLHIFDHFVPAVIGEIHIDIRRRRAEWV